MRVNAFGGKTADDLSEKKKKKKGGSRKLWFSQLEPLSKDTKESSEQEEKEIEASDAVCQCE